jgi:hypothetical protein
MKFAIDDVASLVNYKPFTIICKGVDLSFGPSSSYSGPVCIMSTNAASRDFFRELIEAGKLKLVIERYYL